MSNMLRFLFLASLGVASCSIVAGQRTSFWIGRAFDEKPEFYLHKWDSSQNCLILYRSIWSSVSPAIRAISSDGRTLLLVAPLAELTDYRTISIWDVALSPSGGVVVAATLRDSANR